MMQNKNIKEKTTKKVMNNLKLLKNGKEKNVITKGDVVNNIEIET